MSIPWPALPEGSRVRVRQTGAFPQEKSILGRTGTVVSVSEYQPQSVGVVLDGSTEVHFLAPRELEIISEPALPPEREAAKAAKEAMAKKPLPDGSEDGAAPSKADTATRKRKRAKAATKG